MTETTIASETKRLRGQYLAAEVPDAVADRLFSYAYQQGHANGWHEVEFFYDDLADLVNAAYLAGKDAR